MMELSTENERCEVCRRRDAAVLDDNGRAYCPQCWWAHCEGVIGGRRHGPRVACRWCASTDGQMDRDIEGEPVCSSCIDEMNRCEPGDVWTPRLARGHRAIREG
jgi:hypothetical protein